ncbi:MAG: divalent metal cation transporter [Patescibacteria group bacterium]
MAKIISRYHQVVTYHKNVVAGKLGWLSAIKTGMITGSASNDPAGITTLAQVGAVTGFGLVWLLALIIPAVVAIEEMSARIGEKTHQGLTKIIKYRYGAGVAGLVVTILAVCNIAAIGANVSAMAEILQIFTKIAWEWWVLPVALTLATILIKNNYPKISRYLLWLTLALVFYIVAVLNIQVSWPTAWQEIWPIQFIGSDIWLLATVALLGTTISPCLIFWQNTEEVEGKKRVKDIKTELRSIVIGFIFFFLIALSIIALAATILRGDQFITSAAQAALLLKPLVGQWAFLAFALGIIGSGLIGIPVLASSTAYSVAEAFNWPGGLSKHLKQARGFYSVIAGSLLIGSFLMFINISPMIMMLYTQVLNGILTPILVIILLLITNDQRVMGHHTNKWGSNLLGIGAVALMVFFDVWLLTKIF